MPLVRRARKGLLGHKDPRAIQEPLARLADKGLLDLLAD